MILATNYQSPRMSLTEWAEEVARAAVTSLTASPDSKVVISLQGAGGVGSSFFNIVLVRLRDASDAAAVRSRVEFRTDSKAQSDLLERSRTAVLGAGTNAPAHRPGAGPRS